MVRKTQFKKFIQPPNLTTEEEELITKSSKGKSREEKPLEKPEKANFKFKKPKVRTAPLKRLIFGSGGGSRKKPLSSSKIKKNMAGRKIRTARKVLGSQASPVEKRRAKKTLKKFGYN